MERRHFLKTGATILGAMPFVNLHSVILPDLFGPNETEILKLQIGRCYVTIFRDNIHPYTSEDFFLNVPAEELEIGLKKYAANPANMPSPFTIILLQYDDRKVLLDTGIGFAEKPIIVGDYPFQKKGRLQHLLASENVKKEDITDVILSHFHPDHIGGNFNEKKELNFPNATYHAPIEEWDFWHSSRAENQSAFFKFFIADQVTPLKNKDLNLFSGDYVEIIPGITAVQAHGHTSGHVVLNINFEKEHLLYVSDAFLHPLHIEQLDWQTKYDMDHAKARHSREKVLDLAYGENMLVNAFHFDFPGLGRVGKDGSSWKWEYNL